MDSLLQSARTTILMAFRTFPLIMISFVAFLAVGLGNMGLFVLFLGQTIILPIAVAISQRIFENGDKALYHVQASHVALLVPTSTYGSAHVNVTPSYWLAQTLFFFGYILANAVSIFTMPNNNKLAPILNSNRKSRAKTIIITTVFFALLMTGLRWITHTETLRGVAAAYVVGGLLGYGWYQVAVKAGVAAVDVFGIAQQVIPASAQNDTTSMTCVYAPKP
jgi:hypothetical protein